MVCKDQTRYSYTACEHRVTANASSSMIHGDAQIATSGVEISSAFAPRGGSLARHVGEKAGCGRRRTHMVIVCKEKVICVGGGRAAGYGNKVQDLGCWEIYRERDVWTGMEGRRCRESV